MELKPGYKQTEVGVIPEDWEVIEYNSIGHVIDGDRGVHYPRLGELKNAGYCLFLNAGNVTKSGFQFEDCTFITKEKDEKLNKGKLKRYDVVLTTRGTVGNFAYFDESVNHDHVRINSGMVILRNTSKYIDAKYQYVVLRSKIVGLQVERMAFGSAQPQLTVKEINLFKIPLPLTTTEQIAIASALSDAYALIQSLTRLIAKKRQIKQGAMQTLLDPYENGRLKVEWSFVTYGEVFDFLATASFSRNELSSSGAYGYIHYGDIHTLWVGFVDFKKDFVSAISHTKAKNYAVIKDGDLIMADASEDYDGIGKSVEIKGIGNRKIISGLHTFLLRDKKGVFVDGYKGYIQSSRFVKKQLDRLATGLKVYGVSKANLKAIEIPLPSKNEQIRIATILSGMDAEIVALETKLTKYRQIKQGMMQNLLTGRIRLVKPESKTGAVA